MGAISCTRGSRPLVLATTTSIDDSGLLAALIPAFEAAHDGVRVRVIAVGSGQALALGRRGDADVLFVHAPEEETAFMAAGLGTRRTAVMENDFVIVGPPADPARVRGGNDAVAALRALAAHDGTWVSRGDSSGTHRAELVLRRRAGARLRVLDVGQGMAETLGVCSERAAYTLSDRSTYLTMRDVLELDVLVAGDPQLRNVYSVLTVRDAANTVDATAFADWLLSDDGQRMIDDFGRDRFGRSLFSPVHSKLVRDGSVPR